MRADVPRDFELIDEGRQVRRHRLAVARRQQHGDRQPDEQVEHLALVSIVLEEVAQSRQVLVFTHDERLPEAVRRLDVKATILGVTRRPGSVVEVRKALDPVRAHIEDALALAHATDLPLDVLRRVVPGFCRSAIEASCIQVVRRRWLNGGKSHTEVEDALREAGKLTTLAALAFFDDGKRTGDVLPRLDKQVGRWAADAFRACNEGAHGATSASLSVLIEDTGRLADHMMGLR